MGVPKFEIRDAAGMTNMLIRTAPIGKALAEVLGDHPMVLMRGHGATMVGKSIKHSVYRAVYAAQNAQIQMEAMRFGEVTYLAKEEADNYERYIDEVIHRRGTCGSAKSSPNSCHRELVERRPPSLMIVALVRQAHHDNGRLAGGDEMDDVAGHVGCR